MSDFIGLALMIALFTAWLTHIVIGIMHGAWLFMIVGALLFPVAIAHGVSVWLGFNWV